MMIVMIMNFIIMNIMVCGAKRWEQESFIALYWPMHGKNVPSVKLKVMKLQVGYIIICRKSMNLGLKISLLW